MAVIFRRASSREEESELDRSIFSKALSEESGFWVERKLIQPEKILSISNFSDSIETTRDKLLFINSDEFTEENRYTLSLCDEVLEHPVIHSLLTSFYQEDFFLLRESKNCHDFEDFYLSLAAPEKYILLLLCTEKNTLRLSRHELHYSIGDVIFLRCDLAFAIDTKNCIRLEFAHWNIQDMNGKSLNKNI